MWADVDMWIEVVRGRDAEIRRGLAFLTLRYRYRAYALGIAWPSKMRSRGCRGSTWADVDMQVEVVGGRNAEIRQGCF